MDPGKAPSEVLPLGPTMNLSCAVCLYIREGVAEDADTIINGTAVCYDHMSVARQGTDLIYDAIHLHSEGSLT